MADYDKLVEGFFHKKERVIGQNELQTLIKEILLQEAVFDYQRMARKQTYFQPWIDKIVKGEPFLVVDGKKTQEIIINPNFAETLSSTRADPEKLKNLFIDEKGKYKPVIPATNGKFYYLNKISKDPFTLAKVEGGLEGTGTPDMKEGLAAYFYSIGLNKIAAAEQKIKSLSSQKINLPFSIAQTPIVMGDKASELVKKAVLHLNNDQILKEEMEVYLNAISAAKTVLDLQSNLIIDRGALFTDIRNAASQITGLEPDKWCPGDVYLYSKDNIPKIKEAIKKSLEEKILITPEIKGKKGSVGLNSLFDLQNPVIRAISLKEESALHGRATGFVSIKKTTGEELAQGSFELTEEEKKILLSSKTETEFKNINELIKKYQDSYSKEKTKFENLLKSSDFQIKNVKFVSGKTKDLTQNKILSNTVSKSTCYRFMDYYLSNFKNLKNFNEIMAGYKNPLLALTAYGVSLSGFNPTFYKVQASSKGEKTKASIFKGRDTLEMSSEEVTVIDTIGKAGFLFEFVTRMGEKNYTTTLDIRYAGTLNVSIIVQEFKEDA